MTMSYYRMGRGPKPSAVGNQESAEQREARIAYERELIEEARAEVAEGYFMDEDEADAWLESLGTDNELPEPTYPVKKPGHECAENCEQPRLRLSPQRG